MAAGLNFVVAYNYNQERHTDWYNAVDYYNDKLTMFDRGNARHNLRIAGTWEVPIGKGRHLLSNIPTALDYVIGGWATSSMWMFRSGDLLNFGGTWGGALVTGDPSQNVPAGDYFNPNVFQTLPAYTERTNPRFYSSIRGPQFWQLDTTLVKYFSITERVKFELRMEFYNLPNIYMPGDPDLGVGSGTMGRSTGPMGGNYGREIQYTGRIHF